MGRDLPFPSSEYDFEGFATSSNLQGEGSLDCSFLADGSIFSSSPQEGSFLDTTIESVSLSGGERSEGLQRLLQTPQPSRLEFIKFALERQGLSDARISRLTTSVTTSTLRQYESLWRKWLEFVRLKQPLIVSETFVLEFLEYLFTERNVALPP